MSLYDRYIYILDGFILDTALFIFIEQRFILIQHIGSFIVSLKLKLVFNWNILTFIFWDCLLKIKI